jgi:hypothetical protein
VPVPVVVVVRHDPPLVQHGRLPCIHQVPQRRLRARLRGRGGGWVWVVWGGACVCVSSC